MCGHDWRQWTPAMVPNTARWCLMRFPNADGSGKGTRATTPAGDLRTFESERRAALAASWLNEHPEDAPDA